MIPEPFIPNEEMSVGREPATLIVGSEEFPTEVELVVRYLPSPKVVIRGNITPEGHPFGLFGTFFDKEPVSLKLSSTGDSVDLIVTKFSAGPQSAFEAFVSRGTAVGGLKDSVRAVKFYLVNFPEFLLQDDRRVFLNTVRLKDSQFDIEITAVDDFKAVETALKSSGGYGITHLVEFASNDDSLISLEDAGDEIEKLHYFLSFCRGAWTGTFLPTGLDQETRVVWKDYGNYLVDPWGYRPSWLDRHNFQVLPAAFAGFATKWSDSYWIEVLKKSIYWYLRSNGPAGGTDGGIILTQAALEYLSWVKLVDSSNSLSGAGFERLPAADCLRLLLAASSIQPEVPDTLPELARLSKEFGWDGPQAFTEIRNNLVHPGRVKGRLKDRKLPYYETWNLGQWYVELVLLRLIGYEDVYQPRIQFGRWIGEVSNVPWCAAT